MEDKPFIPNKKTIKAMKEARKLRPFSNAILSIAKTNLKEFDIKTDESFLMRAEMARKLDSL